MTRVLAFASLLCSLACEPTTSPSPTNEPESVGPADASSEAAFTKWCHAYVSSKANATKFEIAAEPPLTLHASNSASPRLVIALDKPWAVCVEQAARCDANAREWLNGVLATVDTAEPGPERERVRAAVRSEATVEGMTRQGTAPITEPLIPGLVVVYMVDLPSAARLMQAKDLEALRIDVAQLRALASANLVREVGSPEQLVKTPVRGIGQIEVPSYYNSSLVLQHAAWKSTSEALGGQLLVAIPVPDLLLYADGRDPEALARLRATVTEITSQAPNAVFDGVLRWTPKGWDVVAPR